MSAEPPAESPDKDEVEEVPQLLQQAFDVFSRASRQLERSYEELKVRADRLAKELALTNEELQRQLGEKERISNFLNNILESVTSGILVVSQDGKIALANDAAERMLNVEADSVEGQEYSKILGDGPCRGFLMDCLGSDDQKPRSREVEEFREGKRQNFALGYAPVRNQAGETTASLLVVQDITRLKLLEEQAVRAERLAAMGEVAAELAHEIRNPLGSIEIFASLLCRDLRDGAERKLAENIVMGVKSLNAVVSNMLTFTRTVEIHPEMLDINEHVRETFAFMEQLLAAQEIKLKLDLCEDLGRAEADPELMKQVLLNLAQNSINAMGEGGVLVVSTSESTANSGERMVELKVIDTGCGIDPHDMSKIFDPFYTTRKGGTGLGLSVASQIVGKHGGIISVDSTPGRGTTMTILMPRSQQRTSHNTSGEK